MKVEKKDFIARFDFVVCLADLHLIPKLPGNYCLVSLDSDTIYSGSSIVLRRRAKEHTKGSTCKRLSNSIKFHSTENYLFCYSLCSEDDLLKIEQTHLDFGFNSGFAGYCNVAEKAGGGNLGPVAIANIKKYWTEERRAERSKTAKDAWTAEMSAKMSKRSKDYWTEERRAERSKKSKGHWTEERKARHSEKLNVFWTAEKRVEKSKKVSGAGNPRADLTIYTFKHKDGRTFTGTRIDFCQKYSIKREGVKNIICGSGKTTAGWSLIK